MLLVRERKVVLSEACPVQGGLTCPGRLGLLLPASSLFGSIHQKLRVSKLA